MNSNIVIAIGIKHLSLQARKQIPLQININNKEQSTLESKILEIPTSILIADVDLPIEKYSCHGTSIYGQGLLGLELVRIRLATLGLTKTELDKITPLNVMVLSSAVPYFFVFKNEEEAKLNFEKIRHHTLLLNMSEGLGDRLVIEYEGSPYKSKHQTIDDGNNNDGLFAEDKVKVEVYYQQKSKYMCVFLELEIIIRDNSELSSLDNWRNAYSNDFYRELFNNFIRSKIHLDSEFVPYEVDETTFKKVSGGVHKEILEYYLAGNPIKLFRAFDLKPYKLSPSQINCYASDILARTGINIKVPWSKFRVTSPGDIAKTFNYPGDHRPSRHVIDSRNASKNDIYLERQIIGYFDKSNNNVSLYGDINTPSKIFCKENWKAIKKDLASLYDAALKAAGNS